jgi:hypothetical protein
MTCEIQVLGIVKRRHVEIDYWTAVMFFIAAVVTLGSLFSASLPLDATETLPEQFLVAEV